MVRPGFLDLPPDARAFRELLTTLEASSLLDVPALHAEDAEGWPSVGAEEFLAAVDTGLSFGGSVRLPHWPERVITTDPAIALRRLEEKGLGGVGLRGAIGGTGPVLDLQASGGMGRPDRLLAVVDVVPADLVRIMEDQRMTLEEAIREAQWKGRVPGNPSRHLHGLVALGRLRLLAAALFGVFLPPEAFALEGMERISREDVAIVRHLRYRLRFLGAVERQGEAWNAWLRPCLLPEHHPLALLPPGQEGALVETAGCGEARLFAGPGSGFEVAVRGMLRDLRLMESRSRFPEEAKEARPVGLLGTPALADDSSRYFYVRLSVVNFVSTVSQITRILGESGVDLLALSQTGSLTFSAETGQAANDLILFTKKASEKVVMAALERIGREVSLATVKTSLRIEDPALSAS